jgi:hypothetical protein
MTMTDFFLARSLEALEAASCRYIGIGDVVICLCDQPTELAQATLDELDLIRWCATTLGPDNPIVAVLINRHATHPDYDPAWHLRSATG